MNRLATVLACSLALLLLPPFAGLAQAKSKTQVKLLSAGKGKRAALRLQLSPGSTERMVMETDMSMSMQMGATAPKNDVLMPTMAFDASMSVGEKKGSDSFAYSFSIDSTRILPRAGTLPQVAKAVDESLRHMKGTRGSGVISSRGISSDVRMSLPPGLPAEMKQIMQQTERTMEQISAPFPIQKVGVGARWRVSNRLDEGGMKLRQVLTYRLASFDGRRGKLEVTVVQTAKPQPLRTPGVKAKLTRYRASGKGILEFDLQRLTPKASMSLTAKYTVKVDTGGASVSVKTTMGLDIRITPKP